MIAASELTFRAIDHGPGRAFVARYHYSGSCPPSQHYFGAYSGDTLVGVCAFRKPSLPRVAAGYGVDVELVRLVLVDEAGKNSESRFIAWTLRQLRALRKYSAVISYADPRFGHSGKIYAATGFVYAGTEKGHGTRRIIDGKEWHSKSAFDRWGCSGAKLKALLPESKVEILVCPPKHVWVFPLSTNKKKIWRNTQWSFCTPKKS